MAAQNAPVRIARDASELAFRIGQTLEKQVIERAMTVAGVSGGEGLEIVRIEDVRAALNQIVLNDLQRELESAPNASGDPRRLSA
jgi:hypothetical protein